MAIDNKKLPKSIIPFLWYFIKLQPVKFFIVLITAVIWSINEIFFPYFLKWIVNIIHDYKGNLSEIYSVLITPILVLIIVWLLMEVAMRVQGIILIYLLPNFRASIRKKVFSYVKQHSHEYFSNNLAGSIAKKIAEIPNSCQNVIEILFFSFISVFIAVIFAFVLMSLTHLFFGIVLLVWFALHMLSTVLFLRVGNLRWGDHAESVSLISGKIVDSIANILTVRLFSRSGYESKYFKKYQDAEIKKARTALWIVEIMRAIQGLLSFIFTLLMIIGLIRGYTQGWVTLGDFSLIGLLAFWMVGMMWYMSYQLLVYVREVSSINESLTLITLGHQISDFPNAPNLIVTKGEIKFDDVSFHYKKGRNVIDHLSLSIPAGQKVGLVGFSGAGKSTFIYLILRFYEISSGHIYIDNQNIRKVTQDSLREQISMIPQDPSLFHRTLMENIRYGRLNASDEEVIAASKMAHCDDFVQKLEQGYDTIVGEKGLKLSGGQRQRIAIARAILKNAPILILDEATSSLDSVTEKYIQQSLHQLMSGKTTIVVAHRLSTLRDMDRIIVFDKGRVVEDGNQESLLKLNGYFSKLWGMQKDGFLPDIKNK